LSFLIAFHVSPALSPQDALKVLPGAQLEGRYEHQRPSRKRNAFVVPNTKVISQSILTVFGAESIKQREQLNEASVGIALAGLQEIDNENENEDD
jgi:hypothetical protein